MIHSPVRMIWPLLQYYGLVWTATNPHIGKEAVNEINVFMNGGELASQPIVYSGLSLEDLIGLPPTSNHCWSQKT